MRLDKLRNERGSIWLNVAASHYPLDGFVNLDNHIFLSALKLSVLQLFIPDKNKALLNKYRQAVQQGAYVRHDCRKPLPVPDESVDHILCSHFLEHVYPDEALSILRDFGRALKPGATLHVIVPDLERQINAYLRAKRDGAITAADDLIDSTLLSTHTRGSLRYRVLEAFGGFGLQHRWMYDSDSASIRIKQLGFEVLPINTTPSSLFRKGDDSIHIVARKQPSE